MNTARFHILRTKRSRSRRGATLLIVLALLSLLVLITATLAYTTRLDVVSSHNFAQGIQRNMAAQSGLATAASMAMDQIAHGPTGMADMTLTRHAPLHGAENNRDRRPAADSASLRRVLSGVETGTSVFRIQDLSARVNVNTADEEMLRRLIEAVSAETGISADATGIARRIVRWRLGPDGAPGAAREDDNRSGLLALNKSSTHSAGYNEPRTTAAGATRGNEEFPSASRLEATCAGALAEEDKNLIRAMQTGVDDPTEYIADIRYPPFGDDRRFASLTDLLLIEGVTPQLVEALTPYVTVFSVTQEIRTDRNGQPASLVDLNRASAEEIYQALRAEYGSSKDDMLLRQFAVNIVDARDEDRVPTRMEDSSGTGFVLGLERTPVISEIYPRSRTEDSLGDDGQYVELFNPWNEPMSVDGWSLRIGGSSHQLRGSIESNGYLIVTDNYNTRRGHLEDIPPGQGSFYDVFRRAANGMNNRIQQIPSLSIPHAHGTYMVELNDERGNLIDFFRYRIEGEQSSIMSFHRVNPVVREAVIAVASPFDRPVAAAPDQTTRSLLRNGPRDLPFTSVVQLFDVSSAYAQPTGSEGRRWGFPALVSPRSTQRASLQDTADPTLLDARIIDLFTVEVRQRPEFRLDGKGRIERTVARDGARREVDIWREEFPAGFFDIPEGRQIRELSPQVHEMQALSWAWHSPRPRGWRQGRININTAPRPVLQSAGWSQLQADLIVRRRNDRERAALMGEVAGGAYYQRMSDILVDEELWSAGGVGNDRCDRLAAFRTIHDRLTLGSRAFLLEGIPNEGSESLDPVRSRARVRALVALDREAPELVAWRFAH